MPDQRSMPCPARVTSPRRVAQWVARARVASGGDGEETRNQGEEEERRYQWAGPSLKGYRLTAQLGVRIDRISCDVFAFFFSLLTCID